MKRSVRWVAAALGVLLSVAVAGAAVQSDRIAHKFVRAPNATRTPDGGEAPEGARTLFVDVGPPDARLEVWVMDPPDGSAPLGTVVVLHGVHDRKASQRGVGAHFAREGLRAVLVDLRGHGGSTGRYITHGAVETQDLVQVLDRLEDDDQLVAPVGAHGASYGGALAILLAGADPRVEALSANSPSEGVRGTARGYVSGAFPGGNVPELYVDWFLWRAAGLAHFDPTAADVVAAMGRARGPAMIAHGTDDEYVPFAHAEALERACAPRGCRLLRLEGMRHDEALSAPAAGQGTRRFLIEVLRGGAAEARGAGAG